MGSDGGSYDLSFPTASELLKKADLQTNLYIIKYDIWIDMIPNLVGGLEHEFYDFPYIGNVIIPTDELIFFRGVGIPPTST